MGACFDNFYTTAHQDYSASGYHFEGITGYIYQHQQGDSVALHHWFHPTIGDNFYTIDEPKTPPAKGYECKGVVGYIYQHPTKDTAPLSRWYHHEGDHLYTTNPEGDLELGLGYVYEGVAGHLFPEPVEGTLPLFCWYRWIPFTPFTPPCK